MSDGGEGESTKRLRIRRASAESLRVLPELLWLLPLLLGVLLWFTRGPPHAPAFADLTAFICDAHPSSIGVWIRGQMSPNSYSCKNGTQLLYQRTIIPTGGKSRAWNQCASANEKVTIWRSEKSTDYEGFVFQSACGGVVYASYGFQAASYNARQTSGRVLAWFLVVLSVGRWGIGLLRTLKRANRTD